MYNYSLGDVLNEKDRMILKPELREAERLLSSTRSPVAPGRLARSRVFPTWNTEARDHTAFGDSEAPYTPYCATKGNEVNMQPGWLHVPCHFVIVPAVLENVLSEMLRTPSPSPAATYSVR